MNTQPMTNRVLCLKQDVPFQTPGRWEVQARYAVRRGEMETILSAGAWLLELEPIPSDRDGHQWYAFRTSSGQVLLRGEPLPIDTYDLVNDPEAARAMLAYRDLETMLSEDYGLSFAAMCRALPPFALIRCPLCAGSSFTTVDFASAWCDRCNANFFVRATAGDPGFVVDVQWEYYDMAAAQYILPRTGKLRSTLVLKDSLDPRDFDTTDCDETCQAQSPRLTDGSSGLRAGLHQCKIGTLYDWRRIYGEVPRPEDLDGGPIWTIDGQDWPAAATMRVLPFSLTERQVLEGARYQLGKSMLHAVEVLPSLLQSRSASPAVFSAILPDIRQLREGERYLLHHWLVLRKEGGYSAVEVALPVWYVVIPQWRERSLTGWRVVRKNICPNCGEPVKDSQVLSELENRWDDPHRECRELWTRTQWQPQFGEEGAANEEPPA